MTTVSRETSRPPRIAIINQKGGVGKTTTAVNLAHGLTIQGKRVLLLDLDAQGNATTALGIEKYTTNASTHDFLFANADATAFTKSRYEGLDVYPANVALIRAELELLKLGDDRDRQLKQRLDKANLPHDFVIIDAPPSLGILTLNILIACDYVLVPVQCEYLALEGLTMLIETIDEIRNTHEVDLSILGCLLTMVDLRTNLSQQIIKDMRTHLGELVMKTLIPRTVRLSECPSHGKTIFEYERWGPGARAYEALCKEFLERIEAAQKQQLLHNAEVNQ
ncbi:ParA family protein [Candidatus Sumerlaeota bacterium]|nr:ParA family protein [Candidatus Sumerlaeota bacterium]